MKTIIAPSILSCDFMNIESEIRAFDDFNDIWMHLDIMDGHFVPNLTFGHEIVKKISTITAIPLDAHFMVSNPEFHIETFAEMNLHNFTFHYEASNDLVRLAKKAKEIYPSVGISIKPGTEPEVLGDELLEIIDLVLVMSVEPGFGGQSFMPNSIEKIKWLAAKKDTLKFQIQVDGGVSDANAKILTDAGADNLVAGSYIFKSGPAYYRDKIDSLRKG